MRQKIVAGNWKMNNDLDESNSLVKKVAKSIKKNKLTDVYNFSKFIFLYLVK